MLKERIKEAEAILESIPHKYCFITGSFLFKEKYKDIDVFVITRSKKEIKLKNKSINMQKIDFNDLYSLFYHSISKSCIAKEILPKKPLKVTISDYWEIINETVPSMLNEKRRYKKEIRYLILYSEYLQKNKILSSNELAKNISKFNRYKEVLTYIKKVAPRIFVQKLSKGYIKRYFYSWASAYKDMIEKYDSHQYLYNLTHTIISEAK